jgi:gamma-glutamyltranspeptidase/glutathione hydrolase
VECPPNGQGIVALEALNVLEGFDLAAMGYGTPAYYHYLIEAVKVAFADAFAYVGDPRLADVPIERLIDKAYAAERRKSIDPARATSTPVPGKPQGGTVYLSVIDKGATPVRSSTATIWASARVWPQRASHCKTGRAVFAGRDHPNCIAGQATVSHDYPALALKRDKLWMSSA